MVKHITKDKATEALRIRLNALVSLPHFYQTLMEAAGEKELLKEFDRLSGSNLLGIGRSFDSMIDEATGKQAEDIINFVNFVHDIVYVPLMNEAN